jgi:predicted transposase/invertase (TIGR01784 family)
MDLISSVIGQTVTSVQIRNNELPSRTQTGYQISDQINIIIIELSKLKGVLTKNVEEMTSLDMWSAFLKYADDPEKRVIINKIIEKKEAIGMAAAVLTEISKDERERAKFLSRRKFETDMESNLLTAEARGEARGRMEEKMETARKMKAFNTPLDVIVQITGFSLSELEKI